MTNPTTLPIPDDLPEWLVAPAPTAEHEATARDCQANGGSITAEELAFTDTWDRYGASYSRVATLALRRATAEQEADGVPRLVRRFDGPLGTGWALYRLRATARESTPS